ncbi:MAG: hypothetical protein ACXIT4_06600 [Erythrobacter sp.]
MRISTLFATGLVSIALAGTAMAAPYGKRAGGASDAPVSRDQMMAAANERFDRLDTNNDGVLDAGEIAAAQEKMQERRAKMREARAARSETAGDEARQGKRERRAERMGAGSGDAAGKWQGRGGQRTSWLARMDADGDGTITREEFLAPALKRFDRADADGDGVVTAEERAAMRTAMMAKRQEMREARQQTQGERGAQSN